LHVEFFRMKWSSLLGQSMTGSENVIRLDAFQVQKLRVLEQNELNDIFAAR
jgi:hypothetical protein